MSREVPPDRILDRHKQIMIQQELNEWDENVKSFVKEKQMTKDEQEKFLEQYDFYLFRGGNPDVEWFYNELYEGRRQQ
jgi:hypothetical protein